MRRAFPPIERQERGTNDYSTYASFRSETKGPRREARATCSSGSNNRERCLSERFTRGRHHNDRTKKPTRRSYWWHGDFHTDSTSAAARSEANCSRWLQPQSTAADLFGPTRISGTRKANARLGHRGSQRGDR